MRSYSSIPMVSGALPAPFGHLLKLVRDPLGFLTTLHHEGDLVRLRLGTIDVVMPCSAELITKVLRDDRTFDKGGVVFERGREVLGNGLGTCPHRDHRRQRRLAQPAFQNRRMPAYGQAAVEQADAMSRGWSDGATVNVPAEMMHVASKTLMATVFPDAVEDKALSDALAAVRTVITGMMRRILTPPLLLQLPTPHNRQYRRAIERLRGTVEDVIAARKSATEGDREDLVSGLLALNRADDDALSDEELADEVMTFFVAGVDTTASTLTYAFAEIAENPELQRRLQHEVDSVLTGRRATHDDLPRLDLTKRVITETLRLWAPVWMLTRTTTVDTELNGHVIPCGTTVAFSPHPLHRQSEWYPEPNRFNPDRWLSGSPVKPPREAFVAFGGGARKCIGDQFGFNEAVLVLATVLREWQLDHVSTTWRKPALAAILRPRVLRMRTTARVRFE